jgi:hypothetical protein
MPSQLLLEKAFTFRKKYSSFKPAPVLAVLGMLSKNEAPC